MFKLISRIAIITLLAFLVACASTQSTKQDPVNISQSWEKREQQLSAIQSWQLRGAIGINDSKQAFRAAVAWQQQNDNYAMQLFGPAGSGTLKLQGAPSHVVLTDAENKTSTASSADSLLEQQTGWYIPVSNLVYWIRGIPAPNLPSKKSFDAYNHLTQLQQLGWSVYYPRYTSVQGIDLPNKMILTRGPMKIRIVVKQWTI